jgi:hypothetical protein
LAPPVIAPLQKVWLIICSKGVAMNDYEQSSRREPNSNVLQPS